MHRENHPSSPEPRGAIPSYFLCPQPLCLSPTSLSLLLLSSSLAIPFGYPAAIPAAIGSRGWPCLRSCLVHRCTRSPPTGGPQCTANSRKAPADTQMDKWIWTCTCKPWKYGSAASAPYRTPHAPLSFLMRETRCPHAVLPRLCGPCCRV